MISLPQSRNPWDEILERGGSSLTASPPRVGRPTASAPQVATASVPAANTLREPFGGSAPTSLPPPPPLQTAQATAPARYGSGQAGAQLPGPFANPTGGTPEVDLGRSVASGQASDEQVLANWKRMADERGIMWAVQTLGTPEQYLARYRQGQSSSMPGRAATGGQAMYDQSPLGTANLGNLGIGRLRQYGLGGTGDAGPSRSQQYFDAYTRRR